MYGLDICIVDIGSIKGISNCIVNFDYGNFESCQFNARNSLSGGVFSVIDIGQESIDINELLQGDLVVTVVSTKKGFEVLCDGATKVSLVNTEREDSRCNRVLPSLFQTRGFCSVALDLFYRNKGPTRIKAGSVSVELRLYSLSAARANSPCTDLE